MIEKEKSLTASPDRNKTVKPLGKRAYGHIAHLPNSRMGPSDHHCHEGQARICTEQPRDWKDTVIVQEKVDGSNCCVARLASGKIVPLTRAGYEAHTSPFPQHHLFGRWVRDNIKIFDAMLSPGERICGEWMAQAHGTRYKLPHGPFVVFDIMRGDERLLYRDFLNRIRFWDLPAPRLISYGQPMPVKTVLKHLATSGHGAQDPVEGAIWRVEREGKVDFLCKYVRPEKKDGIYLPEINGGETVWNWPPTDHPIPLESRNG